GDKKSETICQRGRRGEADAWNGYAAADPFFTDPARYRRRHSHAAEGGWSHDRPTWSSPGYSNCGLHSCSCGRPQESGGGGLSRRVARHRGTDRGKRRGADAAGIWVEAGTSHRVDRARHWAVLLFRGRRGAAAIRVAVSLCPGTLPRGLRV